MKWVFYIFGVFIFMLAPKELIPVAVGLIVIGIAFHINDAKEDVLAHINKMENNIKRQIKDLEIKN